MRAGLFGADNSAWLGFVMIVCSQEGMGAVYDGLNLVEGMTGREFLGSRATFPVYSLRSPNNEISCLFVRGWKLLY